MSRNFKNGKKIRVLKIKKQWNCIITGALEGNKNIFQNKKIDL